MWEGLLSSRAYYIAAAVAFLIAGSGTASAVTEEIGPPTAAFPDDGVAQGPGLFRDGDGVGTSRRDFTSPSGGGNIMSSVGSDDGPDDQGGEPLPELNADYSSSTVDGFFPAWVTGSGSADFDSWINDQTLLGDSDHLGGFSVNASGLWLLFPSNPPGEPSRRRASCSSDESIAAVGRCVMDGDLSSPIATSPGAGSDPGNEPARQIPSFPGSNPPFGGAMQMLRPEMKPAQDSFAMTWPSGVIQGTFPAACVACDVTSPVDDSFTPASDFVNPNESPNSGPAPIPLGGFLSYPTATGQGPAVPEIPQWVMLLIGFAGLALIGRRRLWRSARFG